MNIARHRWICGRRLERESDRQDRQHAVLMNVQDTLTGALFRQGIKPRNESSSRMKMTHRSKIDEEN